ncbi:MAG: UDP-N-acetylmuramoyl-tripeptide--D-alanyl-D-alanine ligase [Patescibacteria group bacterium]
MLQNSEYVIGDYLAWLSRTSDFSQIMYRKKLIETRKARLLKFLLWLITLMLLLIAVVLAFNSLWLISIFILVLAPWIISYIIIIPLYVGYIFIQKPKESQMIISAKKIIAGHKGIKIAIVGSYGKTTAKEALRTVLSEGKKVAATPGNQNTLIGISRFAHKLKGDEDIIIFELGESHVGDIKKLSELTQPDLGIMTGINEAHLKTFKTLERTVATIFEIQTYLGEKPLYKNIDSILVRDNIDKNDQLGFSLKGIGGWKVQNAKTSFDGTEFTLQKNKDILSVKTGLLGLHNIGIMSAVAVIAKEIGLNNQQIHAGFTKINPVEHRLQPRQHHGAWIIDDTYNGNIEGVEVGLELLKTLPAKKRVYVTPGLVEQGEKSQQIHEKIGYLAANVADEIILMKNSTTNIIVGALEKSSYKGKITLVDDPLRFYKNIDQVIAKGDVVLMQNDWTDNYH